MNEPSRRQFLHAAGAATAAFASAGCLTAASADDAKQQPASQKRSEKSKIPFQLALASYTTREFSLDETLKMASRVGLKQICLKSFHLPMDATKETIRGVVQKAEAAGVHVYGCGVVVMNTPAEVDQAFEYAKAAGMQTIVAVPLPDVLPLVNERVKEYDIAVAVHNHGPGDKLYPTLERIHEKIKRLDPRIGYCMDVGHSARFGCDPVAEVRRFADRLLDLHLKDVSASDAKGHCVEMGRGVIDIPALLAALVETGYSGKASFEYEKDENDPLPGLAESVGYTRGVLAMI